MDSQLATSEKGASQVAKEAQEKLDGMQYIQGKGGKAFTNQDIEQQGEAIKGSHAQLAEQESKVEQLKNGGFSQADIKQQENIAKAENAKLEKLKASNAPQQQIDKQSQIASAASEKASQMHTPEAVKEAIAETNQQISQTKAQIKSQNEIQDAMRSGTVTGATVAAAQSVHQQARTTRQKAEAQLDNITARADAGEAVSRTELATAQDNVASAIQQEQQSKNIATAVKAQHATGGIVSEQGIKSQAVKADKAYQQVDKIKAARQNLSDVIEKEGLSKSGVESMAAANQIVQEQAMQQVQSKRQAYADSAKEVQRAESKAKAGRISATELGRIKKRHALRANELKSAESNIQSIKNEQKGIQNIGQFIDNNIDSAKQNVSNAVKDQNHYTQQMSSVARRGGLGRRSTQHVGIRDSIKNERDKFRARPSTYADSLRTSGERERRKEEKLVNKGLDSRKRSPLMHDAINTNRRQNDKNHPDYNPRDNKRQNARNIKQESRNDYNDD